MSKDRNKAKCRASLDQRDLWGRTAINAAAAQGNSEIVALLLQHKADYSIACPGGDVPQPWFTALHYAAERGKETVADVILKHVLDDNDKVKAQMFLNARLKNKDDNTALMVAALNGKASIVAMLLNSGADYTLRNSKNATALTCAACSGDLTTVKAILAHVAEDTDKLKVESFLNAMNNLGKTPLVDAAERDLSTIVKTLLETGGVDYTLQDKQGQNALHYCASKNSRTAMTTILEFAIQDEDRSVGAYENLVNTPDSNGRTPLFMAVVNSHVELTRLLLEKDGATYCNYDFNGNSPLHAAAVDNHIPAAEVYLAQASVASRNRGDGCFDEFLNRQNKQGLTALDLAIHGNRGRFMELLRGMGLGGHDTRTNSFAII